MWLIELSAGFSATALLSVLTSIKKDNEIFLKSQLSEVMPEKVMNLLNEQDKNFGEKIFLLYQVLKKEPDIFDMNCISAYGNYDSLFKKIFIGLEPKTLEPFQLFVYLSLLILLENRNITNKLLFTTPVVGISTSGEALNFFKDRNITISQNAPEVEPFLAAILSRYCDSFYESVNGRFRVATVINDPVIPGKRIKVFEIHESGEGDEDDRIVVLETNLDDTTPEIISGAMDKIMKEGALDYTMTPVTMKKGRLGTLIQILCKPGDSRKISDLLFKWTSTFGIRKTNAERIKLRRSIQEVETPFGRIRVKKGYSGKKMIRISPEYDDIVKISKNTGNSIQNIYNFFYDNLKKIID